MLSLRAIAMLIIASGGCCVSLRKPYWGLLMIMVLYFVRPELWGAEQYIRPVLWLTVAVTVGWFVNYSHGQITPTVKWLGVILGISVISTIFAPMANSESWTFLVDITKIFVLVFLMTELCDSPRKLAGAGLACLAGHLWFLKVALVSWSLSGYSSDVQINTAVGQGGGSNYIAWILASTLPMLAYFVINGKRWWKISSIALIPLSIVAILVTGSRGGLLCLLAGLTVFLIVVRRFRALALLCVLGGLFFLFAPEQRMTRARTITLDPKKMDGSLLTRYQHIQIGMEIISDHPVLGTGLTTFPQAKSKHLPYNYQGKPEHVAHNTFIQMGAEGGLVLLGVFALLNIKVLLGLTRNRRGRFRKEDGFWMEWVRVGLIAALGATSVQMLKMDLMQVDYMWWLYGLGLAYIGLCRKTLEKPLAKKVVMSKVLSRRRVGKQLAMGV